MTCALRADGSVWCWGDDEVGAVGNGAAVPVVSTPTAVMGLAGPAVGIAANDSHSCAVLMSGAVQCWGFNGNGELGTNVQAMSTMPVVVK
jgi:alpha-tubulin suppressor-like RCC1 family protein